MSDSLSSIYSLALLGVIFALGFLTVKSILGGTDVVMNVSLAFGTGWGLYTLGIFICSLAGITLTISSLLGTLVILFLFPLALFVFWPILLPKNRQTFAVVNHWEIWFNRIIWSIIVIFFITAIFLSIGLSYYTWDDIDNWAIKGYGIALQGSVLAGNNWGTNGLSYPLNLPLSIAAFRLLTGDLLPSSKSLFPFYLFFLILGACRYLILRGIKPWIASLVLLFFISTPLLSQHATSGYANIPFTYFLVLGFLCVIEGTETSQERFTLMGGLFLSFATWTRPEGLFLVMAMVLAILISRAVTKTGKIYYWFLVLPTVIFMGIWLSFSRAYSTSYGQAYQLFNQAFHGIRAGQFQLNAFCVIAKFLAGQIFRYRDFGLLPSFLLISILVSFRLKIIKTDFNLASLFFSSILMGSVLVGLHYMGAFTEGDSMSFLYMWLSLEFTRLAMPLVLTLSLLATFLITSILNKTESLT